MEKRDGETSRAEIEAELQQIEEIQAKDPVARDQATSEHSVARIYKALQTKEPLTPEELQLGRTELRWLYARSDGIMENWLVVNEKTKLCVVCPRLSERQ